MITPRPNVVPMLDLKTTHALSQNSTLSYPKVVPVMTSDWALIVSAILSSVIFGNLISGFGFASSGIFQRRPPGRKIGLCKGVRGKVGLSFNLR